MGLSLVFIGAFETLKSNDQIDLKSSDIYNDCALQLKKVATNYGTQYNLW